MNGDDMLSIRQRNLGDAVVLYCCGTLTAGNDAELRAAFAEGNSAPLTVVDMENVTAIDAAGIGALVEVRQREMRAGGRLKLLNVPSRIASLLQLTGLGSVFEVCTVADMIDLILLSQQTYGVLENTTPVAVVRNREAA